MRELKGMGPKIFDQILPLCNFIYLSFLFLVKKNLILSLNNPNLPRSTYPDLIHHDSPNSPFYDPSETPSQRIAKALQCSINHVNHFKTTSSLSTNAAQADIISNRGEYLLKYSVGTPPIQILGIANTVVI